MKKILALLFALAMLLTMMLSMTACGDDNEKTDDTAATQAKDNTDDASKDDTDASKDDADAPATDSTTKPAASDTGSDAVDGSDSIVGTWKHDIDFSTMINTLPGGSYVTVYREFRADGTFEVTYDEAALNDLFDTYAEEIFVASGAGSNLEEALEEEGMSRDEFVEGLVDSFKNSGSNFGSYDVVSSSQIYICDNSGSETASQFFDYSFDGDTLSIGDFTLVRA